MRISAVLVTALFIGLAAADAHAGACDDLNAKVCANAKDAAACARFVGEQFKGSNGERLSGLPRLDACKLLLDDRSTLDDMTRRAAASGDPATAVIGKWGIDLEATMSLDPKMRELPAEARQQAMAQAKDFLGAMSFEFTADGQALVSIGAHSERSTYRIAARSGNTLTVEMTEGEGAKATKDTLTFIVDGDRLTMKQDEQVLVLRRM